MIDQLTYYNVIQAEIATLFDIYTAIRVLEYRLLEIKEQMTEQERTFITLRDE
jgi:hypothetical protein